jgi:hypothetical protein
MAKKLNLSLLPEKRDLKCKLDNGEIRDYKICLDSRKNPETDAALNGYELIGMGTIHSIDGEPYLSDRRFYFYK